MSTTTTETAPAEPQYEYFFRDGNWDNKREILRGDRAVKTFEEIPVVDVSGIYSEDKAERIRVANEVSEICQTVGFMYIKNHGVPQHLTDDLFELSRKYHAQPVDVKMKEYVYKSQELRGYDIHYSDGATGREVRQGSFLFSYDPDEDPQPPTLTPEQRAKCLGVYNQWPENFPGFREKCVEYKSAVTKLARHLMRTFALGLGAEETYFDNIIDAPFISIILQHYPPKPAKAPNSLGAHSDFETFTILNQDMVGGLEVLNRNGIYVKAKPMRGTFVVNIGDFLQRISNDKFVSTIHRVNNTLGVERYSIPFFFSFNMDANVPVVPACTSETNPAKYEPRILHEFTANRRAVQRANHEKALKEGGLDQALT